MPKIHYTHFPVTSPYTGRLQLVGNKSLYWNLGNDKTQQTQRTYAHTNLLQGLVTDLPFTLWTCYGLIIYVVDLLRGCHQLVTEWLQGTWCNGFWPL